MISRMCGGVEGWGGTEKCRVGGCKGKGIRQPVTMNQRDKQTILKRSKKKKFLYPTIYQKLFNQSSDCFIVIRSFDKAQISTF